MLSFATQRCIPVHALIKFTAKRRNAVCIKATADIFPRLRPKEHLVGAIGLMERFTPYNIRPSHGSTRPCEVKHVLALWGEIARFMK